MKVKLTNEQKRYITVAQLPAVRAMIAEMKDYDATGDAETVARIASGVNCTFEILRFDAEIAPNCRTWNAFGDDSEDLDIWLTVYAFNPSYGFYSVGMYLTDLWQSTGDNGDEIRSHAYIQAYKEVR